MKKLSILMGMLAFGLIFASGTSMAIPIGPGGPSIFDCSCEYCSAFPQSACKDIGHNAGTLTDCTTFFFCACDETIGLTGAAEGAQNGLEWREATLVDTLLDTIEKNPAAAVDLPVVQPSESEASDDEAASR